MTGHERWVSLRSARGEVTKCVSKGGKGGGCLLWCKLIGGNEVEACNYCKPSVVKF